MEPFISHTGIVATLNRANVDTDAIIPKQFLKSIKRTGYGPNAFYDWRYTAEGEPDPGFELNAPRFEGRSILVTRNNFGCGSSREHAVWALMQDGYRVILAPFKETAGRRIPAFADIFRINAIQNGLLAIELSEDEIDTIFDLVSGSEGLQATVDLKKQQVVFQGATPTVFRFDIEPGAKERLIKGLDDIDQTLKYESDIARFEEGYDPLRM
ncbi:MAG: 3-isopropylmalate dehydratase small subunit [Desulfobacterales bacterium]|jgi:3-isopropylmalate/(R)-2-methylmalate dehydratase small subunit